MAESLFAPPPPFLAPTVPLNRWLDYFKTYLLAMGLEDVDDSAALLIHGRYFFLALGPAPTYDDAIGLHVAHFRATQSVLVRQLQFRQQVQQPGESVTQYVYPEVASNPLHLQHCMKGLETSSLRKHLMHK